MFLLKRCRIHLPSGPLWQIRSSLRRKPVRPRTSAPPSVLTTETFSRLRAICSICSNQKMLCRPGKAGRRYNIFWFEQIEQMARSEEHTSELQSRQYLVCRLLLEKKKKDQS